MRRKSDFFLATIVGAFKGAAENTYEVRSPHVNTHGVIIFSEIDQRHMAHGASSVVDGLDKRNSWWYNGMDSMPNLHLV